MMTTLSWKWRLFVEVRLILCTVIGLVAVDLCRNDNDIKIYSRILLRNQLLTALSSSGVKTFSIMILIGTIMMRKNGKASENFDDFTVQSIAKAST